MFKRFHLLYSIVLKNFSGMANSVDPDQTALLGSGSALFASAYDCLSVCLKIKGSYGSHVLRKVAFGNIFVMHCI